LLCVVVGAIAGNSTSSTPDYKNCADQAECDEANKRVAVYDAKVKAAQDARDVEYAAARLGKAAVLQALRDPGSAQFGNIWSYESKKGAMVVCGSVNAKNGFGGLTGPKFFVGCWLQDRADAGHDAGPRWHLQQALRWPDLHRAVTAERQTSGAGGLGLTGPLARLDHEAVSPCSLLSYGRG
jgi:hypothetical protein